MPLPSLPEDEDADFSQDQEAEDERIETRENDEDQETLTGVLFGRSVRAYFASLDLVVIDEENTNNNYHVMVRLQVQAETREATQQLRSYVRRYFKNGDLIHITRGNYRGVDLQTEWQQDRFVVDVKSVQELQEILRVEKPKYWGMSQWQAWQNKVYRQQQQQQQQKRNQKKPTPNNASENSDFCQAHHSGGLEKRQQGEFLANFLFNMIVAKLSKKCENPSSWAHPNSNISSEQRKAALEYLNAGTGVLDVAGGSGHVSMALGMLGIKSTVVDPREAAGMLPGRDRKIWNRALKGQRKKPRISLPLLPVTTEPSFCPPAVEVRPFETFRAWFGTPPPGVDTDFRNPDNADVPVCDAEHQVVHNCCAIIALHPDEATDAIVDVAVKRRVPLVIVPCCVFCRLFPDRRMPKDTEAMVSTYQDLLEYLQAKDASIQRTTLPFIGANTVLYSTFEK